MPKEFHTLLSIVILLAATSIWPISANSADCDSRGEGTGHQRIDCYDEIEVPYDVEPVESEDEPEETEDDQDNDDN